MLPGMVRPSTRIAAAALLGLATFLPGCLLAPIAVERETRSLAVTHAADSPVIVRTVNGHVSITASPDAPDVSITAELRAQTIDRLAGTTVVATRDDDGVLRIGVEWPDAKALAGEGCSFDITLPDAGNIDIDTSNGAITITDLSGNAVLRTSNGRVIATRHDGPIDARTSNGSITITDPGGDVLARSSNGGIEVLNAPGRVDADSSNGSVEIELADTSPGPVMADTSNGKIRLTVGSAFRGRLSLGTSNGSVVTERLVSREGLRVSLRKSSGVIEFGDSGEPSSCKTSNGSITVGTRPQ